MELMDQLTADEQDRFTDGRRWVRRDDPLFECPVTWPHEVFIVLTGPPVWQHAGNKHEERVTVRDAGSHPYTFTRGTLELFFKPRVKTRYERIRDDVG